ncbi:MAG: hypothetical protein ABFD97_11995 [Syntrophobacter sp.]
MMSLSIFVTRKRGLIVSHPAQPASTRPGSLLQGTLSALRARNPTRLRPPRPKMALGIEGFVTFVVVSW